MKKIIRIIPFLILISVILSACGDSSNAPLYNSGHYGGVDIQDDEDKNDKIDNSSTPSVEELEEMMQEDKDQLLIILARNKKEKVLTFAYPGSSRVVKYEYSDMTNFYDKYDQYTTVSKFKPGRVVTIGGKDSEGKLKSVKLTDDSWYQTEISKYSIDEERGILTIGDKKYNFDTYTRVFSKNAEVRISQIGTDDVISVQGVDKKVLSIIITTGHGTIALTNTELFEGGWISLGTKIYAKVEPSMTMAVPEGKYILSVANDGYGDTKEIKVKRGKITVVDLSEYEGDGPSFCDLQFEVFIDGARLYIDGQEVDYSEPVKLKYGIHKITVYAKGYEDWEQQLVVHSAEATIQIGESDLTSDGTSKTDSTNEDEATDETTDNGNSDNSSSTDETGESTTDNTSSDDAVSNVYSEYLDTLNNLLDSLE